MYNEETDNIRSKSKKKKTALLVFIIAILLLLASTFLWFTASDSVRNIFDMDIFDVIITEDFDDTKPVTPGVSIDKNVGVQNKGNAKVAVRMKLQKSLQLLDFDNTTGKAVFRYEETRILDDDTAIMVTMSDEQVENIGKSGYTQVTIAGSPTDVVVYKKETASGNNSGSKKTEYIAYVDDGTNQTVRYTPAKDSDPDKFEYTYYTIKSTIKGVHGSKSTSPDMGDITHAGITLEMGDMNKWLLDDSDGNYYYYKLIGEDEETDHILQKVTFDENMDNKYKGAIFIVEPVMEAIQGLDAAAEDEGWNVDINESTGDVTTPRT